MKLVLLDAGPLGFVSNPKESAETQACRQWVRNLQGKNIQVVVPVIADYEVRREL